MSANDELVNDTTKINSFIAKIKESFNNKNYMECINYYIENEKLLNSSSEILSIIGFCYLKQENKDLLMSRNFFNRSITLNKNNIDAVYGLSNVLFEENKFDEAMKFLEEAKKDDPTNINVILLIAQIYERIKEFNKAINEYNYLLSFSPNNFQAILSLSIIENTIGKYDSACERLISLNKEHSNDVKVLMNLSKALLKLKRIDECMKWVEHALTLYNKNTYLYEIYMECLDKKADYNKLETVCRETLRVDKKNAKAIAMLIKSYQKNQKLKELESLLEKINSKLKNKNIQEDYSKKIQNKLDNIVKTTKLEQFEFEKRKKLIIPEEDIQSKMVKLENSVSQNTNESETARHVDMLKKDSSNKDSIFYLAIVFFKKKEYETSYNYLMKLKELDSNFKQEAVNELIGDVNFKFHKNYTLASSFFEEAFMSNKNSIFLVKMGRCAEKLKEYEFALKCYKKTIQLNNNYTIGLLHIGWLISRLGDTERGLEYLKTAFELAPEKPEVISKYCLVLSNIPNSQEKSNSVLKKALALDPENSELIIAYAKSFEKMGLIDEAIATIEDAFLNINEIKENIKAIYILGMFYEKKNNVNKSIQLYKSILNKKKNHIPSLLRLGNLLCSLQEYTRSMKYIMYALQLNQNIPQANFCVGKIFHGTGDLKNAKKFYRICEEQDPSFYKVYYQKGLLFLEKKKNNLAKAQFQKCIDLNPSFHPALIGMANVSYNEFLYDKAEHFLRQAIVIEPNDNQAIIMMGNVMMATKRFDDAIYYYKKGLEENGELINVIYNLANCYYISGKIDAAIGCYVKAIKLDENQPDFYYNLGNALSYKDKYKEAIRSYKKAIYLKENFIDAYFNLGNAYYMLGKYQEAVNNYIFCSKSDENSPEIKFALVKVYIDNPCAEFVEISTAKKYLQEFLNINYNYVHSLYYYGKIMEKEKNLKEAKEYYNVFDNLIKESSRYRSEIFTCSREFRYYFKRRVSNNIV